MGLMSMCPACGSDWCNGCECVKKEQTAKFAAQLRKLARKNDGTFVLLKDVEDLVKKLEGEANL